jgi:hypothetical protein
LPGLARVDVRLVAGALFVASIVALSLLPQPAWWHIGYPLDAASANKDGPLGHPAPGAVGPMSLFALSGLATWSVVQSRQNIWWRLALVCVIVQIPFAGLLYDQSIYDSIFGTGRDGLLLFLVYTISGYGTLLTVVVSMGLYAFLGAKWLGPRMLRIVRLDRWWSRSTHTELEFTTRADALALVKDWAERNGAAPMGSDEGRLGYQLPMGDRNGVFFTALILTVAQTGERVRIEAGIVNASIVRLLTLGTVPVSMPLASGGFAGVYARRKGRTLVNSLLSELGGPQIG